MVLLQLFLYFVCLSALTTHKIIASEHSFSLQAINPLGTEWKKDLPNTANWNSVSLQLSKKSFEDLQSTKAGESGLVFFFELISGERFTQNINLSDFAHSPQHSIVLSCNGHERPSPWQQKEEIPWDQEQRARLRYFGLIYWSSSTRTNFPKINGQIRLIRNNTDTAKKDIWLGNWSQLQRNVSRGELFSLHCQLSAHIQHPFQTDEFKLEAVFSKQESEISQEFYFDGNNNYALKMRLLESGTYHLTIKAYHNNKLAREISFGEISVQAKQNEKTIHHIITADKNDSRFFTKGKKFYWPCGINIRSTNDQRSHEQLHTTLTQLKGADAYRRYIKRFRARGINLIEIWMSGWNLGLEWNAKLPGYNGLGWYNLENATELDKVFRIAQEEGMMIQLVIHHHGQWSSQVDAEWDENPYNKHNGGMLKNAASFFSSKEAQIYYNRLRSYIIARYAAEPALFGWKIFTEIDLTDQGWRTRNNRAYNKPLSEWHKNAAKAWHEKDPFHHMVCTHWSDRYARVDQFIARMPELQYLTIDAYHGPRRSSIIELMKQSSVNIRSGLFRYHKPFFVSEYGGAPHGAPVPQLQVEYQTGPWAALVSGHAASPMFWWYEWADQSEAQDSFLAIAAYLDGEDLRSKKASTVKLETNQGHRLWCQAWAKPGRILGYCAWSRWAYDGRDVPERHAAIHIGNNVPAGKILIEWWQTRSQAKNSTYVIRQEEIQHPGGKLSIMMPPHKTDIAFKCIRLENAPKTTESSKTVK